MSNKVIHLSKIIDHLKNGITRLDTTPGFDPEKGSIQSIYGLTPSEVDTLFKHPKLKGLRTKAAKATSFELVDDTEAVISESGPSDSISEGGMDMDEVPTTPYSGGMDMAEAPQTTSNGSF